MQAGAQRPEQSRAARRGVAVAICCILSAAGCSFKKPTVRLHDIQIAGLDFHKLELVFELKITNPNAYQISIWGLEYALAAAGQQFASGALPQPIAALGAKQTTHIRAPVAVEFSSLRPLVSKLRAREPIPYEFAATTTFNALGMKVPVPLRHGGEIPPLETPSWHFRDARLVGGVAPVVELVFDVDNPNRFELPLKQLKGFLKCGDRTLLEVNRAALTPIPATGSARLTLPLRVHPAEALAALTQALKQPRSLRFEGKLLLGEPASLRDMLLGKANGED